MFVYIKEWPDSSATIILNNDIVLWTFNNVEEAARACHEWYDSNNIKLIPHERSAQDINVSSCAIN
ncbi:MAG: hypothetical protein KAU21_18725 [Gammaproteobacteria bacterium]|nr:hypothetical protein [Gammaproteobacteria bacterium]